MGIFKKSAASFLVATLSSSVVFAGETEISGLIEADFFTFEDYDKSKTTDITVGTVEVGIDTAVSDRVDAHILFLYEAQDKLFTDEATLIDEVSITLHINDNFSSILGKIYIPFGVYESNMITDPLTLELAETQETVALLDFSSESFYGSGYLFKGATTRTTDTDDNVTSYGLNVGFRHNEVFDVSLGYLSNLAETNALQELSGGVTGIPGLIKDDVPAMSISATLVLSYLKITAEHIDALGNFVAGDFDGLLTKDTSPSASYLEFAIKHNAIIYAVAYQQIEDPVFPDLPENIISAAISFPLVDGAYMGFQYSQLSDYSVSDGGTGEDASLFIMQVSTEF